MTYVFVTKDSTELVYQNYEEPIPPRKDRALRLLLKALGGVAWFWTTFDLPVLIWGT